jgi:glycosyltransferase involved in cell wall biosynthesis
MRVAVLIPAYNEAATIRDVATRALACGSPVVVIDDGSTDSTAGALAGLPVTLLRNASNQGKAASLWLGMQHALAEGADGVVTLDGDGQHNPEDIPRLVAAADAHAGAIVIGSRMREKTEFPRRRLLANQTANFCISWACGYRVEDSQSGFRFYPAALLRRVRLSHDRPHGFVFESEILIEAARLGVRSVPVPIAAIYRPGARASHFHAVRDVLRIGRMVAWKLLCRALYPQGLWSAFVLPRRRGGSG